MSEKGQGWTHGGRKKVQRDFDLRELGQNSISREGEDTKMAVEEKGGEGQTRLEGYYLLGEWPERS